MNINLARKWRSKQFDEIVGQPLAVRLLKNSLYRNLLFPVYLLSGTRGTGKTSTARIFAAAVNCKMLKEFQKEPQNHPLPCLSCDSCKAMQRMEHPDVIEIDAASHTGVDNVRQIIEAASFVPVLGGKKIYLIDEAHMLSKAAFNAFLKILEEPPQTVVFMLVTTDPHKIIPTVLSRCFQVFFDPIKPADIIRHLTFICEQEGVSAEPEALILIAQESEGCMRDALNLLERLRALPELVSVNASPVITKDTVLMVLGSVDDDRIGQVLFSIVTNDPSAVLDTWVRLEMARFSPSSVWKKLVETLRRSLWLKQSVAPDEMPIPEILQKVVDAASYERLIEMLEVCYSYELSFAKTSAPGILLEVLLLKMVTSRIEGQSHSDRKKESAVQAQPAKTLVSQVGKAQSVSPSQRTVISVVPAVEMSAHMAQSLPVAEVKNVDPVAQEVSSQVPQEVQEKFHPTPGEEVAHKAEHAPSGPVELGTWGSCLRELEGMQDPLVVSIFKQCARHVYQEGTLELTFSQDLLFFKDWLGKTEAIWKPIIEKFYGVGTKLQPNFDGVSTKQRPIVAGPIKPVLRVVPPSQVPRATPPGAAPRSPSQAPVQQTTNPQPAQKTSSQASSGQQPQRTFVARGSQKTGPQEPEGKAVSPEGLKTGSLIAQAFPGRLLEHGSSSKEGI